MKKLLALVLALCLCFTTAACAPAADTSAAAGSASAAGTETAALNVWAIESAAITDYATNGQSRWMEQQTGVSVNWMAVPAQGWYSAFQASVMAEEDVDVYLYPFDTMEAEMLGSQMGCIIPLEELITPENTPNLWAMLEADPELKSRITAPDGHIYTLFASDVYELSAYTQKLWVNRAFLEKYTRETGCGMPATTEEFAAMLRYFGTHDMNGNGRQDEIPYIGQAGVDGMYNLFGAFLPANSSGNGFGCYRAEDGTLCFAYDQQAYREALAYVRDLYAEGLISPDTFTISAEERCAFTSGSRETVRAGVVTGVTASQVVQLSTEPDAMTYDDYVALPPLAGPDGVRTIMSAGETRVSLRNAITTRCEDPETAIRWLDAGYSETARLYAVYGGLEGVDWSYAEGETLNGPGRVVNAPVTAGANICWGGQGIVFRVTEQDYLTMDAAGIAANDALATYRANLAYRPYLVRSEWPSIVWPGAYAQEAAEYAEYNGLIQKAVTEYYTDVILGRRDLQADWDGYVQELQQIGLERYLALNELYMQAAAA